MAVYDGDYEKLWQGYDKEDHELTEADLQRLMKQARGGNTVSSFMLQEGAVIGYLHIKQASITSATIKTAAIETAHIRDANITNAKIQNAAIDNAKIKDATIDNAKIKDATITTAKIGLAQITNALIEDAAITTAKISDAAITTAKIQEAQIFGVHIVDAEIDTAKISDAAITSAKIGTAAVKNIHIEDGAIDNVKIGTAAIGTANIKDATITTALIQDEAVIDSKIVSLNAGKITAGTIDTGQVTVQGPNGLLRILDNRLQVFDAAGTTERVSVGDVNGDGTEYGFRVRGADGVTVLYDESGVYEEGITDGAITNPKIGDGAVTNRIIAANTITGDKMIADSITAREIKAGTITAASGILADASIGSANIIDGSISTAKIGDAQITNAKIDSIHADKITAGLIDSERIRIGASTTFDPEYDPTKIEVGGRNLRRNGDFTQGDSHWLILPTRLYDPTLEANYVSQGYGWSTVFEQNIEPSKEYTISCMAREGTNPNSVARFSVSFKRADGTLISNPSYFNTFTGTDWEKKSATFTTPAETKQIRVYLLNADSTGNAKIDFSLVKLEKGNKETDWTPAPEDVASYTDEKVTQSQMEALQQGKWSRTYDVNTSNPLVLRNPNGTAFDNNYSYEVTARVLGTGTDTLAVAHFLWNGSNHEVHKVQENGTSVNHPEFFVDGSGNPAIRLYDHSTLYTVSVEAQRWIGKTVPTLSARLKAIDESNMFTEDFVKRNTGNLVDNPTATGDIGRWISTYPLSVTNQDFFGVSVPVIESNTSSNAQNYSGNFNVDPSKAYLVSAWIKKSAIEGSLYLGAYFYTDISGNTSVPVDTVHDDSGSYHSRGTTNPYFWSTTVSTGDWVQVLAYVMPTGTPPSVLKGIGEYPANTTSYKSHMIMQADTKAMKIRFLNWNNTNVNKVWVANVKVVEVDPNAIVKGGLAYNLTDGWLYPDTTYIDGGNLYTGTVTANSIASKTITANEIKAGTITSASGVIGSLSANDITTGTLTGVTITSDDGSGGKIILDDGSFEAYRSNNRIARISSTGFWLYDNTGSTAGNIRDAHDLSTGDKGLDLVGYKNFIYMGFDSTADSSYGWLRLNHKDKQAFLVGSNVPGWDQGRLFLKSTQAGGGANGKVPAITLNNYLDSGGNRWSGIVAQTGRDNSYPDNGRFGFEVWQYLGTSNGANKQMMKIDTDSSGSYLGVYTDTAWMPKKTMLKSEASGSYHALGGSISSSVQSVHGGVEGNLVIWYGRTSVSISGTENYAYQQFNFSGAENIFGVFVNTFNSPSVYHTAHVYSISATGFRVYVTNHQGRPTSTVDVQIMVIYEPN
jgi:uncharacterized protein YjbI with pentapeptide repeats